MRRYFLGDNDERSTYALDEPEPVITVTEPVHWAQPPRQPGQWEISQVARPVEQPSWREWTSAVTTGPRVTTVTPTVRRPTLPTYRPPKAPCRIDANYQRAYDEALRTADPNRVRSLEPALAHEFRRLKDCPKELATLRYQKKVLDALLTVQPAREVGMTPERMREAAEASVKYEVEEWWRRASRPAPKKPTKATGYLKRLAESIKRLAKGREATMSEAEAALVVQRAQLEARAKQREPIRLRAPKKLPSKPRVRLPKVMIGAPRQEETREIVNAANVRIDSLTEMMEAYAESMKNDEMNWEQFKDDPDPAVRARFYNNYMKKSGKLDELVRERAETVRKGESAAYEMARRERALEHFRKGPTRGMARTLKTEIRPDLRRAYELPEGSGLPGYRELEPITTEYVTPPLPDFIMNPLHRIESALDFSF